MTTDLWALVGTAFLQWILILAAATPRMAKKGVQWSVGNRSEEGEPVPEWAQRLQRASDNLAENLILFAVFVLVVHVSGSANDLSAMGALVFLGARVGHAIVYGIGIPVLRTLLWAVGVAGMLMVAAALF